MGEASLRWAVHTEALALPERVLVVGQALFPTAPELVTEAEVGGVFADSYGTVVVPAPPVLAPELAPAPSPAPSLVALGQLTLFEPGQVVVAAAVVWGEISAVDGEAV